MVGAFLLMNHDACDVARHRVKSNLDSIKTLLRRFKMRRRDDLVRRTSDPCHNPRNDLEQQTIAMPRERTGWRLQLLAKLFLERIRDEGNINLRSNEDALGVFGATNKHKCSNGRERVVVQHRPLL